MAQKRPQRRPKSSQPKELRGIIRLTRKGVGYVSHTDLKEDVEIAPENLNTALNGDTVTIRLKRKNRGDRISGYVLEVNERARDTFVGVLEKRNGKLFLVPDNKRMYTNIAITDDRHKKIGKDTKALVQLLSWDDPNKEPQGTILEVIGKKGLHETEMRSIVLAHGFETDFKNAIEKEAQKIGDQREIDEEEIQKRRDFRDVTTFTIDPEDAKDFDDALSVQQLPSGLVEVGIHIADVSHYVKPGSAIDLEARDRGTSIYLVDRTIPMLPEVLSNDVCSLNPNEDKLTYSAVLTLDREGAVKERWFGETIIHSDKRFTYEEAQEVLDTNNGPHREELQTVQSLAVLLREKRFKKGAIDFDQEEISFTLDSKGKPTAIVKKQRIETNRLIEEFMLLANQEVATHFQTFCKKLPAARATFLYRIHDLPNEEKIEELGIFLRAIGYDLNTKGGEVSAKELNRLFKEIEGAPEENLIKTATIRSMAKAVYSTKNIGHFGLSFKYYTHFTSPIRRYPDVMVHRILKSHLNQEPLAQKEILQYETLAVLSSQREVEAVEAERDSIKLKQVEYMQDHIGEEFTGVVSGVVDWGLYVEEKNTKAEGLVRVTTLGDDFYELDRKKYALVGNRSKKAYTLGDTVQVRLVGADLEERTLEWKLLEE